MSYVGFKKLQKIMAAKGATNPAGAAASVMRKKYKQSDITKHQKSGTSMKSVDPKKKFGY